jgi:hypothetical protein
MNAPSPSGNSSNTPTNHTQRRPWDIPPGLAGVLVAVIAAVSVYAGRATAPSNSASPAPAVTVTASPTPDTETAHLEFALTADSTVAWCQFYYGTGTIPIGYKLAIFTAQAGLDGQPTSPAYYSFASHATPITEGHWRTEALEIGTKRQANFRADIIGVLISAAVYRYINSISASSKGVPWTSQTPPPGREITLAVITDGKRGLPCQ